MEFLLVCDDVHKEISILGYGGCKTITNTCMNLWTFILISITFVFSLSFDPGCQAGVLLDIVFVLDSSIRLGSNNFNSVRDFASRIVQQFVVDQNDVRVGVVTFADNARNEMYLSESRNVANDIRNIQ